MTMTHVALRLGRREFVQRFGSALNLNLHLHSLVLDGIYTRPTPEAVPVFHPLPAPTDDEVAKILERVHERIQKLLRRRGRLPEDSSPTDPVAEPMPLLAEFAAASIQERLATSDVHEPLTTLDSALRRRHSAWRQRGRERGGQARPPPRKAV
jgi:hypothetical protein